MNHTCIPAVTMGVFGLFTALSPAVAALRQVPKPVDRVRDFRARAQPTVPDGYTETPFVERSPAPELTDVERQRGYLLFHRPITEPVYPTTHPLAHERLSDLTAFATPGEFESVSFSVYPVRTLRNMRVRVSALRGPEGELPAAAVSVRLVTYWNLGYPRYTSRTTYRRVPELLERVTVHSSPAEECQRWWVTVHVPEEAPAGVYRGAITVWDDGFDRAVEIPLALRVLPFRLKSDPAKHYSVYYNLRNRVQFEGHDEAWARQALDNEYRAMTELGIDSCPTFYLRVEGNPPKIAIANFDEFQRLQALGLRGPVPLAGGSVIAYLYQKTTPEGERGKHWRISKLPPDSFYGEVTRLFRRLAEEAKAKGWPELICCPLDEVDASRKDFGARVYKAVREAGVRTYITKDPTAADAADYREGVDVWCSQPYSMPYEKITAQERYEYWCYPNHNAGEIKDRRVMCKGGRMTYGFGFWRSGYTTLIPWHWAWTPGEDQFDYLRGSRSGCGQRLDEAGEVIPAVYWHCFREGRDDARYLYTLQQAIWEREPSPQVECRRLVAEGRAVLQETWDAIHVQQKYLAEGMWPSEEFNARRWRLAQVTEALLAFPAVRQGNAPSVLVKNTTPRAEVEQDDQRFLASALERGLLESQDLGGDFSQWVNATAEGKTTVTTDAGLDGKPGLRWRVKIDHQTDGGEGGAYPIGWPRIRRTFGGGGLDAAQYDYLLFRLRVQSNRDEVAADTTPVGFTLHSNKFFEVSRDLGGQEGEWRSVLLSVPAMIASVGQGEEPWRHLAHVQMYLAERNFAEGTELTFDLGAVKLLRFKSPTIRAVDSPSVVLLPAPSLPVTAQVRGTRSVRPGTHRLRAALLDDRGVAGVAAVTDLATASPLVLDLARLTPGTHTLRVAVEDAAGNTCSSAETTVRLLAGPFWGTGQTEK